MATDVITTTFLIKRGWAEAWARVNPVLAQGEPGWAMDTKVFKIGDGITPWNDLPAVGGGASSYIEDLLQEDIIHIYGGSATDVLEETV